ncbi:hypothetical protein K491DRAFT_758499 [Lophiostoma macrostomum CBS 122681]|uniref:Flavin reductase like domain-containing protein n=1 Tax=Lophiostoma macrostomum CBS 122681 TaxID=1314788 RepID=A0A6A6T4Z4_9PLEO|nr:hypothetical protein K491DRAFT_758499 [Lophiostoma macrostomum CBS 122681]
MFYEPGKTDHGLPNDPFKACVIPRPIGWISTLSPSGTANLAPYSQFNNLTFDPPYVMFSANQTPSAAQKDTTRNVEATGVFCWQLATYELKDYVNATSEQLEYGVDEFEHAGLEKEDATLSFVNVRRQSGSGSGNDAGQARGAVRTAVPMVKRSPIKFECTHYTTLRLPGNPPMGAVDVVIGRVIGIHIDESVLTNGRIDVSKTVPIARCGYFEYAAVREVFEMRIPGMGAGTGLEGSVKGHREMLEERQGVVEGKDGDEAVGGAETRGK